METTINNLEIIKNIISDLTKKDSVEISQKPVFGFVQDLKRILGDDKIIILHCPHISIEDIPTIITLLEVSTEKIILMDDIDRAMSQVASKLREISVNNKVIFRNSL